MHGSERRTTRGATCRLALALLVPCVLGSRAALAQAPAAVAAVAAPSCFDSIPASELVEVPVYLVSSVDEKAPEALLSTADLLASMAAGRMRALLGAAPDQLPRVPADATHLVVSAGGNDALGHTDLLSRRATSSAEVLGWFADAVASFEARYRRMVTAVVARGLPVTLCTIYEGNLGEPVQRLARVALAMFDDAIVRVARAHALPVIELRHVCTEPADYANPIEPSVRGGEKVARAIAGAVGAV